jgi:hypothetical protein
MDQGFEQPYVSAGSGGHLDRLARWLLVGGVLALAASSVLTWAQIEGYGGSTLRGFLSDSTVFMSLLVQVLAVLAGALLTGAAFAYVMRAVRLDQQ